MINFLDCTVLNTTGVIIVWNKVLMSVKILTVEKNKCSKYGTPNYFLQRNYYTDIPFRNITTV